jgi:hypothetical protein
VQARGHIETMKMLDGWVGIAAVIAALTACGGSEGSCEDLCAMEAQCGSSGTGQDSGAIPFDEAACRSACTSLVEDDPAFADGVAERVGCLEEQLDEGLGCGPCSIDGS